MSYEFAYSKPQSFIKYVIIKERAHVDEGVFTQKLSTKSLTVEVFIF